jgi:hypothetical protein
MLLLLLLLLLPMLLLPTMLLLLLSLLLFQRVGLPRDGALFKSVSGELSNLRWDLPLQELPSYWGKPTNRDAVGDWNLLDDFVKGLAGGGPVPR